MAQAAMLAVYQRPAESAAERSTAGTIASIAKSNATTYAEAIRNMTATGYAFDPASIVLVNRVTQWNGRRRSVRG
jgi:hypothetical protein